MYIYYHHAIETFLFTRCFMSSEWTVSDRQLQDAGRRASLGSAALQSV